MGQTFCCEVTNNTVKLYEGCLDLAKITGVRLLKPRKVNIN